jgi:hypothetical protein
MFAAKTSVGSSLAGHPFMLRSETGDKGVLYPLSRVCFAKGFQSAPLGLLHDAGAALVHCPNVEQVTQRFQRVPPENEEIGSAPRSEASHFVS